jgi:ketosteroid isomerase-like protein
MNGHPTQFVDLPQRFGALWEAVRAGDKGSVDALAPLYGEDMVFQDPLQTIRGREDFLDVMRRLVERSREVAFRIESVASEGESLFASWTMELQPRLGPRLRIEGATHARTAGGVIVGHRDYWDLLQSVTDAVPLAGAVYRSVAAILART